MFERAWPRLVAGLALLLLPHMAAAQEAKSDAAPPQVVASAPAVERPVVRIGTNLVAGLYFPAGGALCRAVAKYGNVRCLVESTNGSTSNIRGLLTGALEFGIVQSDWQYHAVQGSATFRESGPVKTLRSVLALHGEPLTLVVRADAGIENFGQIKGKRVGAGPGDSGQHILFDVLVAASGWRTEDFAAIDETAPDAAATAFCAGTLDALFLMGNHPNAPTQRVLGCGGRLVAIDGPLAEKVTSGRRYYAPVGIPAGLYGPDQPAVPTLGVRATLVALESTSPDLVYALVSAVAGHFEEFTAQHPGLGVLKRDEIAAMGLTAPLHEGALRYFREVGLIK